MTETIISIFLILIGIAVGIAHSKIKSLQKTIMQLQDQILTLASNNSPTRANPATKRAYTPPKQEKTTTAPLPKFAPPVKSTQQPHTPSPTTPGLFDKALSWMQTNWLYTAAALLLALAGVFLIIYGIENGLLTPGMRILGAYLLGSTLIGGGEYLRRKKTDTDNLPAVLSSSGLITLYGASVAGHGLYAITSASIALASLVGTAILALALGGRNRPFLTAAGIIGACLAPFMVGGETPTPIFLPTYYLAVVGVSIAVGWFLNKPILTLTGLGLTTLLAPAPIYSSSHDLGAVEASIAFQILLLATALLALFIHPKSPAFLTSHIKGPKAIWRLPRLSLGLTFILIFPLQLAAFVVMEFEDQGEFMLYAFLAFSAGLAWWSTHKQRLLDTPSIFMILPLSIALFGNAVDEIPLEHTIAIIAGTTFVSVIHHLRLARNATSGLFLTALLPVASALIIQLTISPFDAYTLYWPWVLMGGGALMLLATTQAYNNKPAAGFFAISTLALITHSLASFFDDFALTYALTGLLVAATYVLTKFKLPYVHHAITLGIGGLLGRLLVYPGPNTLYSASWLDIMPAYLVPLAGLAVLLIKGHDNIRFTALTAISLLLPSTISLFLFKAVDTTGTLTAHYYWLVPMACLSFMASGFSLSYLSSPNETQGKIKYLLAQLLLGGGVLGITISTLLNHPAFNPAQVAMGYPLLNPFLIAYLLPSFALIGMLISTRLDKMLDGLKYPTLGLSMTLITVWIYTNIRFIWHTDQMAKTPIFDGEHIAYTLVTLAIGAIAIPLSLYTSHPNHVRRIGLTILGLAIAKALFIDIASTDGLIRVASLLALGLAIAGMAFIDKKLAQKEPHPKPPFSLS